MEKADGGLSPWVVYLELRSIVKSHWRATLEQTVLVAPTPARAPEKPLASSHRSITCSFVDESAPQKDAAFQQRPQLFSLSSNLSLLSPASLAHRVRSSRHQQRFAGSSCCQLHTSPRAHPFASDGRRHPGIAVHRIRPTHAPSFETRGDGGNHSSIRLSQLSRAH